MQLSPLTSDYILEGERERERERERLLQDALHITHYKKKGT